MEARFVNNANTTVFGVDCIAQANLCSKMDVQGYPTIRYYGPGEKGEGDQYYGSWDAVALETFLNDKLTVAGTNQNEL